MGQPVLIADQLGDITKRDSFLQTMKTLLQNWYTAGAGETGQIFYHDSNQGLERYLPSYGSDIDLNDHFHYAYFVWASAIVGMYDPNWAADDPRAG